MHEIAEFLARLLLNLSGRTLGLGKGLGLALF